MEVGSNLFKYDTKELGGLINPTFCLIQATQEDLCYRTLSEIAKTCLLLCGGVLQFGTGAVRVRTWPAQGWTRGALATGEKRALFILHIGRVYASRIFEMALCANECFMIFRRIRA